MSGRVHALLAREAEASAHIPYTALVSDAVLRTSALDYLQVFHCGGASFECADDEQLNNWHERLNTLWRNLADPSVALWAHVVRRRQVDTGASEAGGGGAEVQDFPAQLRRAYLERLGRQTLMINDLYVTVVHRPLAGVGGGLVRGMARRGAGEGRRELQAALDACAKQAEVTQVALARYEPQRLGVYRRDGRCYSQLLEFLALLVNGEWQPVPLPEGPVREALAVSRVLFGREAIEYRTPTLSRFGAVLGIKEYANTTVVGVFNRLLTAPLSFVMTQSFTFLSRAAAQGVLQRQVNRLENAGDLAASQIQQLREALDGLASGNFAMGDHHWSLQVLSDAMPPSEARPEALRLLNERVALARGLLTDSGVTVAREDLALEAAYWAQLPGNFGFRPRRAPISTRNWAAMNALHNYPRGREHGNHWGEAIVPLVTNARSPYFFSLHASDPNEPASGRHDTGHTLICGPTGSGKTVLIGFLIAMLRRFESTQVIFDKDRGLELLVRALGGIYLPLRAGKPTGFNPLALPETAEHVEFLKAWLRCLTGCSAHTPPSWQSELDLALGGTLALDRPARRLSRLIEFLDRTSAEGLHARLVRWCECTGGDYAWAFDNATDSVVGQLGGAATIGVDVTDFLSNDIVRAPITLYLFHLVRALLDGRRLVCWMDEFWRLLGDPAFEGFAKDGPKTWRKLNGVMCLATQSVSDVLGSAISRTIVEQTPTKIFFPNADAVADDYIGGMGLSEREFRLIKQTLTPGSRMFLLKQAHQSVVAQLDLSGMGERVRVLSGRSGDLARMRELMSTRGQAVNEWLPAFLAASGSGA